ncbi:MAG TPA: hypothetical protein VF516_47475, partial [Kofleriaceae bacterium]
ASPAVLDPPARLAALRPDFAPIAAGALADYFRMLVDRLFDDIDDNEVILACMLELAGCEVLGIAPALAGLAIGVLVDNTPEGADAADPVIDVVLRFARASGEQASADHQRLAGRTSHWERRFFREWVLCVFSHWLVHEQGPVDAHDRLLSRGWFERGSRSITLEMEREAHIAIGSWWYLWRREDIPGMWYVKRLLRSDKPAEREDGRRRLAEIERGPGPSLDFLRRVHALATSPDRARRESAFYILRHTSRTKGAAAVPIDPEFHDLLRQIYRDRTLRGIVQRYAELFRINLPELDRPPRPARGPGGRRRN